ncbi:TPA: ubiquinol-cytochrome C reductase [Klebsiella quasipneumoniae subsp. quasipneumoniae]|nr:ubiquinol-cytochrome C reductase [Klebsiella quasipneumoniae subsp. quasipneumoniae]
MSLYNDLVRHEFGKGVTADELESIQNRKDEGVSDLMLGISAIGSLMFWATDNGNYTEETAKGDMRKIGAMLGTVGEVVLALNDIAANAGVCRSDCGKESKVRSAK